MRTALKGESNSLNCFGVTFAIGALLPFAILPVVASGFTSQSLDKQVRADGSAYMTQHLAVSQSSAPVEVPLLSPVLSNVLATDQNGASLSFRISGSNMTVYTPGATAG